MNRRNAVLRAFQFQETHPVPYTIWYDEASEKKITAYYGNAAWQSRIRNYIFRLSLDWQPHRRIDSQHFLDIHGSLWKEGNPRHLERPALRKPELKGFDIPSYKSLIGEGVGQAVTSGVLQGRAHLSYPAARSALNEQRNNVFTVVDYGHGLFETAWMIRGYEDLLGDLVLHPGFVHDLLDRILDRQLELLDAVLELPADGVMVIDDYGDQRGVMIGARRWREFFSGRLAALYQKIHGAGKMTFHHSCGNICEIIPDLIDIGLDVLQSVQPEAMPVYDIKRRYGRDLRLWGGFGTQQMLPFASPLEIRSEVKKLQSELGEQGGFVLTSSKPIMQEVPVENSVAFIEAVIADQP